MAGSKTYITIVFIAAFIVNAFMGCSTGAFLPGLIPNAPSSPFYDQMRNFKDSLASDPQIGHLKEIYDGNRSSALEYGSRGINRTYQENYRLNGQFKGRGFSLHQAQIETLRYHEPVWIPVRVGDGQYLAFLEIRPGYLEKSTIRRSSLSVNVSSRFEAKIWEEGVSTWLRKKLLRQQEVITGIVSMDQAYFVRSDEAGIMRRLLKDSAVQGGLEVLKKDHFLPVEIAKDEIRIERARPIDPTDSTKYLDALNNIGAAVEKISYLEWPDGCP
jgi:hypothetical protein